MNNTLNGQTAIVTGAASGLGRAIAMELQQQGVQLSLVDNNLHRLKEIPDQATGKHELFSIDIANEEEVKRMVEKTAERFGKIDILINCAGITGKTNIKSHIVDTEDLKEVFNVNFMGSWYTSKYVLPIMQKNNYGRILHFASIAGKEGNAGMLAYSSSKAAVIGMTKVQGKEYAETGITINALAPAVIRTALVEAMPAEQVRYMTDKIPMKRCGTLDEAVNITLYIISPQNSFTTGFVFDLSGGRATY